MNRSRRRPDGRSPAEIYEQRFVPALFHQWGAVVADSAAIAPGQHVLDVACGTGVLASAAADRAGDSGRVVGLDVSREMLDVARRKRPDLDWREDRAESLPFADGVFDAVVSQFGLMFFDDRQRALKEMMRVLRAGGRLAIAVCDSIDNSPGYATLAALLERLFGPAVADAFRAPFSLGDASLLKRMCDQAGIVAAEVTRRAGTVRFASIDSLVSTERACAWTLGGMLDDAQFELLRREAEIAFQPLAGTDGRVAFDMPALVIRATKQEEALGGRASAGSLQ